MGLRDRLDKADPAHWHQFDLYRVYDVINAGSRRLPPALQGRWTVDGYVFEVFPSAPTTRNISSRRGQLHRIYLHLNVKGKQRLIPMGRVGQTLRCLSSEERAQVTYGAG